MNKLRFRVEAAMFALLLLAGAASAQTPANVAVVSGNGQIVCQCSSGPSNFFFQPLIVKVTDANGAPVNGANVNWTVTAGGSLGSLLNSSSTADANGVATIIFTPTPSQFGSSSHAFDQATIVATAGTGSATFIETVGLPNAAPNGNGVFFPPINIRLAQTSRDLFTPLSGAVGSTVTPPFQVQVVTTEVGQPVPNVAVQLINDPTIASGTALCQSTAGAGINTALTDQFGLGTCTPVLGGTPNPNPGQAQLTVGGAYPSAFATDSTAQPVPFVFFPSSGAIPVKVTPGAPGVVRLISGASQVAQAGQTLAASLVVEVDSSAGVPLAGQTVNWTVSPAGAGTLGSATTTTDTTGRATNTLRLATSANGAVTVTASVTGVASSATFTATAIPNITVTGLTAVSGNGQSAVVNTAFSAPLVVQLNATGGAASGIPVTFSITGPATLSATSVNTDASGRAQVTVQAGATAGAVTVTASATGASPVTFNLTVAPAGPSLQTANFVNAADFQRGALSPCSLATVFAKGLAPGIQGMISGTLFGPLPAVLGNDRVTVGGATAPILSVGTNPGGQEQLTFQVPCDVTPGSSVPVAITVGTAPASSVNIPIQAASPGVFQTVMSDGVSRAVLVRPDGSFVSLQNPARRGENLIAFLTGLGPAAGALLTTNSVALPATPIGPSGQVVVGMAGGGVPLISAQLSDELVGIWMVTFTVPAGVTTGNSVSFSVSVIPAGSGSVISSGTTSIPVQ